MSQAANNAYSLNVSRSAVRTVSIVIGAVILLLAGIGIGIAIDRSESGDALSSQVNSSRYQAVFLTSNEVYFGKLSVPSGNFAYLTDVYRLTSLATHNPKQPLRRTLVRLVTDVQSPEDELVINKSSILYVENLNPNGTGAKLLQQGGGAP